MKLVRCRYDHCFDLGVVEHLFELAISDLWFVNRGHFSEQVRRQIANGIKLRVPRFAAGVKMRALRNRAAAQDPDPQQSRLFFHG